MSEGMIQYNIAGIADYTHALSQFSAEFDHIGSMARNTVAGLAEYFETQMGSGAYTDIQNQINSGLDECQAVLARHSSAVDVSASSFQNQDHSAASAFGGC